MAAFLAERSDQSREPMKAWQVHQFCEPSEMSFDEVPTPAPGEGEVLIRNHGVGVNFFDILFIQGKYQAQPGFPFTPGGETAGTIEAVGPGVSRHAVGDRVLARKTLGGYAEYSVVPAKQVFPIPGQMSYPEASGYLVVYQTSYFALHRRAQLRPDEWLLVHAGASGVGMSAIQLGKAAGARVIATAGSAPKRDFCKEQGADHVIDYRDSGWVDQVKELTGGAGANVIYDPVGGDIFDLSTKCIASGGRLLVVGFAGGRISTIAANRILLKNMSIVGIFWGRESEENPDSLHQTQRELDGLYEAGKIRPIVSATYPLAEAPKALADLAERRVSGKVALTIDAAP